jgi:hypothetical protein
VTTPTEPVIKSACTVSNHLSWINAEEEFIRTNSGKIRDGDVDETVDFQRSATLGGTTTGQ